MKKKLLISISIALLYFSTAQAQVGINTSLPDASAYLDINGVDRGFLPPRMKQSQRDLIVRPATGLIIYNLSVKKLQHNVGTPDLPNWQDVGGSSSSSGGTTVKAPDWFYMPVTVLSISSDSPQTFDLYNEYVRQFNFASNSNSSTSDIPKIYPQDEIEFYVLAYDTNAFSSVKLTKEGILTYTAIPSKVTKSSYLNVIIKIK